jgi:TRAP-type C4-dicarboxylate transport system permease small subunit
MDKLTRLLQKLLSFICVVTFVFITIIGCWQVASRFVFNNPAAWTEEALTYGFTWMALLTAALVVSKRDHMRLTFVIDKFNPTLKKVVEIINELAMIAFSSAAFIYGGISIMKLTMVQVTPAFQAPMGMFYSILPISGGLINLFSIMNIINIIRGTEDLGSEDDLIEEGI